MKLSFLPSLFVITITMATGLLSSCDPEFKVLKEEFANPSNEYRPQPFWWLNGELKTEEIKDQLKNLKEKDGFGGVAPIFISGSDKVTAAARRDSIQALRAANPNQQPAQGGMFGGGMRNRVGTTPKYLSEEYFDSYGQILQTCRELGIDNIFYDDIDYPSGNVENILMETAPEYCRKFLTNEEVTVKPGKTVKFNIVDEKLNKLHLISGFNTTTMERVNLTSNYKDGTFEWTAPGGDGEWKVMVFHLMVKTDGSRHSNIVDYLDPVAVEKFMELTYYQMSSRFPEYLGSVITKNFFDDLGATNDSWTAGMAEKFKELYGKDPALYYPALYYEIGPETEAARVALYECRSELMAEGYLKVTGDWCKQYGVFSMGHPPGSYGSNCGVSGYGDLMKYYRHVDIPLTDWIFGYSGTSFGGMGGGSRNGFKQVSSAADYYDRPIVGAEVCGAFSDDMDHLEMYRAHMDLLTRGINFMVPHGAWYDTEAWTIHTPPEISNKSEILGPYLPEFSSYIGRMCALLQGGRNVSEVAVYWPINEYQSVNKLTGGYGNMGQTVSQHQVISGILTDQLRRDFTFIPPEGLETGKISVVGNVLRLNNETNWQEFKVLFYPGGDVISATALKVIKEFYENGGKIIAVGNIPSKSAEFGQNQVVVDLIKDIFGIDPTINNTPEAFSKENLVYLPLATAESIDDAMDKLEIKADVDIDLAAGQNPTIGAFNYIHKIKDGKDIYFFSNTTDKVVDSWVTLRGKIDPEMWDPHSGTIGKWSEVEYVKDDEGNFSTRIHVVLDPVTSIVALSK